MTLKSAVLLVAAAANAQQIEPRAGTWTTFVIRSGDELRVPPPPDQAATASELAWLRTLPHDSNPVVRDQIKYWDAGAPAYRWIQLALNTALVRRPGARQPVYRTMALLNVAIYDATIAAWSAKYAHNRPRPSQADTANRLFGDWVFNIHRTDGSPVGSIMATGWAFGDRAAGVLGPGRGDLGVSGGTGAFLGVRGQGNETGTPGARRAASVAEDPANRRIIGGNAWSYGFQLIPMTRPDFAKSGNTPMVFHADFTPVTAANPARKGEVLIAAVTGLGPTLPGKTHGAPFSADTLQEVASPIQVLVNGTAVNSANQVGWARHDRNISCGLSCAGRYRHRNGRRTASQRLDSRSRYSDTSAVKSDQMRRKKRTVCETETHRVITMRGQSVYGFCRGCGREVEMILLEPAAEALGTRAAELHRRLVNSGSHFTQFGTCIWVCGAWYRHPGSVDGSVRAT